VGLEQIDVIGAQLAQTLADGLLDVLAGEVGAAHLGGEKDPLTRAGPGVQGLAQGLLRATVGFGGVDQGHPVVEGVVHGADRLRLVHRPHPAPDRPGAEPDHRHRRPAAAQNALLHGTLLQDASGAFRTSADAPG
jgi:hypothetical protein